MYQIVNGSVFCSLCYINCDNLQNTSIPSTSQDQHSRNGTNEPVQKIIICSVCEHTIADNLYSIFDGKIFCQLCCINQEIHKNREHARAGQKRSADKMLADSAKKYRDVDIGSTVLVQVPRFDRGPLDSKNIIGNFLIADTTFLVCLSNQ